MTLNYRHFMKRYNLCDEMLRLVNVFLAENGLESNRGTIVDATHHRCAHVSEEQRQGP